MLEKVAPAEVIELEAGLLKQRALALSMAVMTQVHVARVRFDLGPGLVRRENVQRKIVVMCLKGGRSHQVCAFVGPTGPDGQAVFNLTGGIQAWHAAGLPVVSA